MDYPTDLYGMFQTIEWTVPYRPVWYVPDYRMDYPTDLYGMFQTIEWTTLQTCMVCSRL